MFPATAAAFALLWHTCPPAVLFSVPVTPATMTSSAVSMTPKQCPSYEDKNAVETLAGEAKNRSGAVYPCVAKYQIGGCLGPPQEVILSSIRVAAVLARFQPRAPFANARLACPTPRGSFLQSTVANNRATSSRAGSPLQKSHPIITLVWLQQMILRASNCNL